VGVDHVIRALPLAAKLDGSLEISKRVSPGKVEDIDTYP
jgi:hypothetical protein